MTQDDLEKKVKELEGFYRDLDRSYALLQQRNDTLEKEVANLRGGISRGLWILGGGFIAGFASWIMSGGLSIVR